MRVAPHVGAWIEIWSPTPERRGKAKSHPTWVRGLKSGYEEARDIFMLSHPTWVRGLKFYRLVRARDYLESHPTWVRGLKSLSGKLADDLLEKSHPTWVRGLKFRLACSYNAQSNVAPHVGAWIEIQVPTPSVTRPAQAALPRAALWIASRAVTSC